MHWMRLRQSNAAGAGCSSGMQNEQFLIKLWRFKDIQTWPASKRPKLWLVVLAQKSVAQRRKRLYTSHSKMCHVTRLGAKLDIVSLTSGCAAEHLRAYLKGFKFCQTPGHSKLVLHLCIRYRPETWHVGCSSPCLQTAGPDFWYRSLFERYRWANLEYRKNSRFSLNWCAAMEGKNKNPYQSSL